MREERGERAARRAGSVFAAAVSAAIALGGCHAAPEPEGGPTGDGAPGSGVPTGNAEGTPPVNVPPEPPSLPLGCPDLYADDLLPTFELDVSDEVWAALQQDLVEGEEVYYPAVFRLGGEERPDARVRLRGNNSRCGEKLQLAISFNQVDPAGRFHGLRRLDLDHGGCRLLEERLALSFMRDLGLPTPCANHARLVVNGAYYGLFVNVEHANKDFLRRNFGAAADDGNLYKSGWSLSTNEAANDTSDLVPWDAAGDAATLASLGDLDEAVLEWAAEAVLPARDNYWLRGYNYYLYHHPARGFLFVPNDLDQAFPGGSGDVQLATLLPDPLQRAAGVALADPAWRLRYEEAVRRALAAYDPATLAGRLDRWWAQIAQAEAEDPFSTYSTSRVRLLETWIEARAAWLREEVEPPPP